MTLLKFLVLVIWNQTHNAATTIQSSQTLSFKRNDLKLFQYKFDTPPTSEFLDFYLVTN